MNMLHAARGPRREKAFSLILVLVVGVAAFAVATTLLIVSESASTRGAHALQGERAEAIAQAGFERTLAYMAPLVDDTGDFDKVLDPNLDVNCSGLPVSAPTPSPTAGRPAFGDGAPHTYRFKVWTRVPYDDGAYLVRFDDDNDDFHDEPLWSARTDNNVGTNCIEGPAALGGGGGGGEGGGEGGGGGGGGGEPADNPFRDRNGAIWITVIGIAPGTDPDRAVHRSTIRRLHHIPTGGVVEGLVVKGNVDIGGNGNLEACSPVGSLRVDGNVNVSGSGTGCACGDSRADSFSNFDHCTSLAGSCASVGCALGSLDTPGPTPPDVEDWRSPAGKTFFFDWSRPCIFLVDDDTGDRNALWFWDANADHGPGGARCSTLNDAVNNGLPFPSPPTPDNEADFRACWTPLITNIGAATTHSAFGEDNVLGEWTPGAGGAGALVATRALVNQSLTDDGFTTLFPTADADYTSFTRPDWATACRVDHPGDSSSHDRCTTCGVGAPGVMSTIGSRYLLKGDTPAEINAVPAGVYVYDGNISLTGGAGFSAPAPTDPLNMSQFPLATLVLDGNIDLQVDMYFGAGQAKASFPSIITNGSITYSGSPDQHIAGSVWMRGNWNWSGNGDAFLYGELHTKGNWNISGSGDFFWRYRTALSTPTGGSLNDSAPTTMVSLD